MDTDRLTLGDLLVVVVCFSLGCGLVAPVFRNATPGSGFTLSLVIVISSTIGAAFSGPPLYLISRRRPGSPPITPGEHFGSATQS